MVQTLLGDFFYMLRLLTRFVVPKLTKSAIKTLAYMMLL